MSKKINEAIQRKASKVKIVVTSVMTEAIQSMTPNKETFSNLKSFANFGANELEQNTVSDYDKSMAMIKICINYLKNIFPHETMQNKKTLTKSEKFSFKKIEAKILEKLKSINIKHFKSSLEKEDQDVIEMFCSVLFIKDIKDITKENWPDIMSRIYNKNVSRDLQDFHNSQKSNPDFEHTIIIPNSYINFDSKQKETLTSYMSGLENLKIIDFTGNKLKNEGTKNLMEVLIRLPHLSELILSNNNIGLSGTSAITKYFFDRGKLKTLDLSKNNLAQSGAFILLTFLFYFETNLKKLNISYNHIDDTISQKILIKELNSLCDKLSSNEEKTILEQILDLIINRNEPLIQLVLNILTQSDVNNTKIEALDMSNNKIGQAYMELTNSPNNNSELKELYLGNNDMSVSSTTSFFCILLSARYLEIFDIIGNRIVSKSIDCIKGHIMENQILQKVNINFQDLIFEESSENIDDDRKKAEESLSIIKGRTLWNLKRVINSIDELICNLIFLSKIEGNFDEAEKYVKEVKKRAEDNLVKYKWNIELFKEILLKRDYSDEDKGNVMQLLKYMNLKDKFYQPLVSDFLGELDEAMDSNILIPPEPDL